MSTIYNNAKRALLAGELDFDADTLRVALISDATTYTPDPDGEQFVSDIFDGVTAEEFGDNGGTGYSRQTLTSKAVTQDNTDDEGVFDAGDATFSTIDGETVASVVVYQQNGGDDTTPGDDVLVAHITSTDFPKPANGGDIIVEWAAEGIVNAQ